MKTPASALACACALLTALATTAAQAEVVGYVQSPEGRIDLHEDRGPCKAEAKRAEYVPIQGGEAVTGCWISKGKVVGVVFLDGDVAQIPVAALMKPLAV